MTQSLPVAAEAGEHAFNAWAEVYDTQPNPLLLLEQRVLGSILPDVRGLDVLDVGCGTGRWLQRLAGCSPGSLTGVDISAEMLQQAAAKLGGRCNLHFGSGTRLPVGDASTDMVLSCFALSYIHDLPAFVVEIDRVARPGATLFFTDMHPETETVLGWSRGHAQQQMRGYGWTIAQITQAFQARGFKLVSLAEPLFGVQEREIFEGCGKAEAYDYSAGHPAIYVMQWRKPAVAPRPRGVTTPASGFLLGGARCAIGPDTAETATVSIVGDRIESIAHGPFVGGSLDLSGYLLLPGLINAHDHLEFSLYPNIGSGPYCTAEQWARDIHAHQSDLISRHRSVPRSTSVWWGAIRNLLCGATTVCHHNPVYPELMSPDFPVRVVTEFGWAHSLGFEPQLAGKFANHPADLPFILHAAEGVDDQSAQEIFELDRLHAIDHRTVVVHGLACGPDGVNLINQRGASVVLCPTSNEFLFQRSPSLAMIRSLKNVILGSDSPLTAPGDLLDEIKFVYTHTGLDARSVYSMVTNRAATVLRRKRGEGCLRPGSVADLLVVRDSGLSPSDALMQLTSEQIELVIVGGRVQLAGPAMIDRLPPAHRRGLHPFQVDGHPKWVRAPIDRLLSEAEEVLGAELRVGKKRMGHAIAS